MKGFEGLMFLLCETLRRLCVLCVLTGHAYNVSAHLLFVPHHFNAKNAKETQSFAKTNPRRLWKAALKLCGNNSIP